MGEFIWAMTFGLGIGMCNANDELQICDSNQPVVHIFADAEIYRWRNITLGGELHHFSRPETEDIPGKSGMGSGGMEYIGLYAKAEF